MDLIQNTSCSVLYYFDLDVFRTSGRCADRCRYINGYCNPMADICKMGMPRDRQKREIQSEKIKQEKMAEERPAGRSFCFK